MTARTLVAEFQPLEILVDKATNTWNFFPGFATNYSILRNKDIKVDGAFYSSTVIDLSGYAMQDLTTYFRRSFEQIADSYSAAWGEDGVNQFSAVFQQTIISSVPLSEDNLIAVTLGTGSPGFMPNGGYSNPALSLFTVGTFDRTHIIHGHQEIHNPSSILGTEPLTAEGSGFLTPVTDNYYSSLEPTAADCLYCYRVIIVSAPDQKNSFQQVTIPGKRVILDAETSKEDHLEYMMRLARSYELANQV